MSYSAAKHQRFSERMQQWMKTFQAQRDELARIDEIYTNETASGGDAAFTDTDIATEQEHIDGIVMMRALKDFVENSAVATADRTQSISPFTQE